MLDPIQFALIPAHVTLCREDELEDLPAETLRQRLAAAPARPVVLTFGAAEPFSTHGILLPCIDGEEGFHALRQLVLGTSTARRASPHITLAHPRNPKAAGNRLAAASTLVIGMQIRFGVVSRIRQEEGHGPWQITEQFDLSPAR